MKPRIISEATLRLEDLIPALANALLEEKDDEVAKEVHAQCDGAPLDNERDPWWQTEEPMWLYEELTQIAYAVAEPFCYFGSSEGDGACIGWFADVDSVEEAARYSEDVIKIAAGDPMPEWDATEFVAEVTDHGNVTLWQRHMHNGFREWRQVWSVI